MIGGLLKLIGLVVVVVVAVAMCQDGNHPDGTAGTRGVNNAPSPPVTAKTSPTDSVTPESVAAKWGKPDLMKSTEYDSPRPPLVTKSMDYTKERVRFLFLADGKVGDPPPYSKWIAIGVTDPVTNTKITVDEAIKRLRSREKR